MNRLPNLGRRVIALFTLLLASAPAQEPAPALKLVAAARAEVGVTVAYDPAYVVLEYPGGDVPVDRGVCTDVVIRAFRTSLEWIFKSSCMRT